MLFCEKSFKGLGLAILAGVTLLSTVPMRSETKNYFTLSEEQFQQLLAPKTAPQKNVTSTFVESIKKAGNTILSMPAYYKAALGAAFFAVYRFNMKVASDKPARYDISKLGPKTLLNNPKLFFKHTWYVIDDFIIGRAGEGSTMKVRKNKETGKIVPKWSAGYYAQGIGGNLHFIVLIPLAKALGFPVAMRKACDSIGDGAVEWSSFL